MGLRGVNRGFRLHRDAVHAGRDRGPDPGPRILEGDCIAWVDVQLTAGKQVRIGPRLVALAIFCGHDDLEIAGQIPAMLGFGERLVTVGLTDTVGTTTI